MVVPWWFHASVPPEEKNPATGSRSSSPVTSSPGFPQHRSLALTFTSSTRGTLTGAPRWVCCGRSLDRNQTSPTTPPPFCARVLYTPRAVCGIDTSLRDVKYAVATGNRILALVPDPAWVNTPNGWSIRSDNLESADRPGPNSIQDRRLIL